jgi:hypothetical protein
MRICCSFGDGSSAAFTTILDARAILVLGFDDSTGYFLRHQVRRSGRGKIGRYQWKLREIILDALCFKTESQVGVVSNYRTTASPFESGLAVSNTALRPLPRPPMLDSLSGHESYLPISLSDTPPRA